MSTVDYYAIIRDIMTRVYTEADLGLGYDIEYPNKPIGKKSALWIRASVQLGDTMQACLGTNAVHRTVGVLFFQVFGTLEKGEKAPLQAATAIADLFRSVSINKTVYASPSVTVVGRERGWWQLNVECPFHCDSHL